MYTFVIILLIAYGLIHKIKLLRLQYGYEPPLEAIEIVETITLPEHHSPITSFIELLWGQGTEGGERQTLCIEFSITDSKEERLTLFRNSCKPSPEVKELTYYWYKWPRWWQELLLPNYKFNSVHFLYPESWIHDNIPHKTIRE